MKRAIGGLGLAGLMIFYASLALGQIGRTEVTMWQYGKRGASRLPTMMAQSISSVWLFPSWIASGSQPRSSSSPEIFQVRNITALSLVAQRKQSLRKPPRFQPTKTIASNEHRQSATWAIKERSTTIPAQESFMMRVRT